MAILVNPYSRPDEWRAAFAQALPDEELWFWPEVGDPDDVEFLVAWLMRRDDLATFTNLRAIMCMGAGTEQWQKPGIEVPVVRLADPAMADDMAAYALTWVIRHQRRFADVERTQRQGLWQVPAITPASKYRVGVLGYGEIGARVARAFQEFGYVVNAWTRSGRDEAGVNHFAGIDELEPFLSSSDAVINVLPSTAETTGLLTAERFSQMVAGSLFVNIGRGTVVADEDDLIAAIDIGPLGAAVLDVTSPEPPIERSPLYRHPAITLTPHVSGMTNPATAAQVIAANVRRMRAGEEPHPLLDRGRGY